MAKNLAELFFAAKLFESIFSFGLKFSTWLIKTFFFKNFAVHSEPFFELEKGFDDAKAFDRMSFSPQDFLQP